jgi:hypothetical protein
VPTLVEAAAAIYDQHNIREISHSRAGQDNLDATLNALLDAARHARATGSKILCIVTGVPGAGKTLAGLNAISHLVKALDLEQEQAAFLSGNGPLVNVLRKALGHNLSKQRGRRVSARSLESVIQEMHRFVRDTCESSKPPAHRAVVFDEAQRAWSRAKNREKFARDRSEPEMVLEIMGRHSGWSLVVGLVGGGQEIHSGEAGLSAWGDALAEHAEWTVWASPEAIEGGPAVAGSRLFEGGVRIALERVVKRQELHLAIPKRNYEAENNARWVNAVLEGQVAVARRCEPAERPRGQQRRRAIAGRGRGNANLQIPLGNRLRLLVLAEVGGIVGHEKGPRNVADPSCLSDFLAGSFLPSPISPWIGPIKGYPAPLSGSPSHFGFFAVLSKPLPVLKVS